MENKKIQTRKFVIDYVVDDEITAKKITRINKGEHIRLLDLVVKNRIICPKLEILDENQKLITGIEPTLNSKTWAELWNCTVEAA